MSRVSKHCRELLGVVLCQLLILQSGFAQQPTPQTPLKIIVVQGDGARNPLQQIPPQPLVVRVEDERLPVSGATVTFTAPMAGPSGQFANGSTTLTVNTDRDGLAIVDGFHPNATGGSYLIGVRAAYQGVSAVATIHQYNVEPGKGHGKLILFLSLAGAGAGAALIAKGAHSSSSSTTTGPTITLGDGAVGAPRP